MVALAPLVQPIREILLRREQVRQLSADPAIW